MPIVIDVIRNNDFWIAAHCQRGHGWRDRTLDRTAAATRPSFGERTALWLDTVLRIYEGRLLQLIYRLRVAGAVFKGLDLAVAATAFEHGLTVATRNISDFEPTGVSVLNPFSSPPPRKR